MTPAERLRRSKSQEVARRAEELLAAIESGTVPFDILVAKALGLARDVGDVEAVEWLACEAGGYALSTDVRKRYAMLTDRWDGTSEEHYPGSAAKIAHAVTAMNHALDANKQFEPGASTASLMLLNQKVKNINTWTTAIQPLEDILSAVRAHLHLFASRILVEAQFSETSRSLFERYQSQVDAQLAAQAATAFEKIPSVFERLQAGEPEAISHALTSCRRIIDSFADAVFPPRPTPVIIDGTELDCGADKTKNRIRAFIASKVSSRSRRDRINRNLASLYDRVSAGVHSDVAVDEAQALVLNTYLLLGELISLPAT
jgi:hypothetical protein